MIKLSVYSSFSLFECRKVVNGSKSLDVGNGTQPFSDFFHLWLLFNILQFDRTCYTIFLLKYLLYNS